ncbi:hypothetical protein ACIPM2_35530 [Streptomyces sp. NPDC086081]|uniref:hypothetical protein n=1 Tax=Streptomyces sp. NPDC086081 TaxID=3365749 RepID=UPI00380C93C6
MNEARLGMVGLFFIPAAGSRRLPDVIRRCAVERGTGADPTRIRAPHWLTGTPPANASWHTPKPIPNDGLPKTIMDPSWDEPIIGVNGGSATTG